MYVTKAAYKHPKPQIDLVVVNVHSKGSEGFNELFRLQQPVSARVVRLERQKYPLWCVCVCVRERESDRPTDRE